MKNLKIWTGEYHTIDAWGHRRIDATLVDGRAKPDHNDDVDGEANYQSFMRKLNASDARGRVYVVRNLSTAAAMMYPDEHFDWIYIDTLHTAPAVAAELRAWWPKLRPGGLMSGDDYADAHNTPHLDKNRIYRRYPSHMFRIYHDYHWGVVRATQEFAREMQVPLFTTWLQDCYNFAAWYMVKPFVFV